MLAVVALTPLSRLLASGADRVAAGLPPAAYAIVALVVFVAFVVVLWEIASLPAMVYLALRVDARYGRASAHIEDVIAAQFQATLLVLPAALIAGGVVRAAASVAGAAWWIVAGLALAALLIAVMQIAPRLLATLAGARPLPRADLAERLAALGRRGGVPIARIFELPAGASSGTTALVSGLGRRRHIFVSSELVRHWTDEEIDVVIAHELGHHAHGDLWRTLAFDAATLSAGLLLAHAALWLAGSALGLAGAGDLAALPFIALMAAVAWSLSTPLRHAASRRQERRADAFALALTGGADAFDTAIRRLAARNLAEERPSTLARWLFHAHPTVVERLDYTRAYRELKL